MKHKNLAIIPARGGSKRIPRKNIRPFLGRPVMAYSIEAALKTGLFDEVMVSTNDTEIADLARTLGAGVPFLRTEEASCDFATTADVIIEVIGRYRELGRDFTACCCIYPTAPFVTPANLAKGFELLNETGSDSVVPVVRFGNPIQRAFKIEGERLVMAWPEYMNARSQDLFAAYHDAGQFYWCRVESMLLWKRFFTDKTIPIILPEAEVQDIDTEEDWRAAEIKYTILNNS